MLTDRSHRFDEIAAGYRGKLYLEVVPRTFAIRVKTGLALNQVRLIAGDSRLGDRELAELHERCPLLYLDSQPLAAEDVSLGDGLFVSLDVSGSADSTVGYRARKNSLPIDLTGAATLRWEDYWDPVHPERGGRIVLEPEVFYLLLSAEGVSIPPAYAAEMLAYDPTAGELRTHYAGFFDPGFGYARDGSGHGSRAALEVRARDVSFMVEHRQPVCKLAFERMAEEPDVLYGEEIGSNYQGQQTMLSKHFLAGERARLRRRSRRGEPRRAPPAPGLRRPQPAPRARARKSSVCSAGPPPGCVGSMGRPFLRLPRGPGRRAAPVHRATASRTRCPERERRPRRRPAKRTTRRGRSRACASRATRSRSSGALRSSAASPPRARCSGSRTSPTSSR